MHAAAAAGVQMVMASSNPVAAMPIAPVAAMPAVVPDGLAVAAALPVEGAASSTAAWEANEEAQATVVAQQKASEEGLVLLTSLSSSSGYRGVCKRGSRRFEASYGRPGADRRSNLGVYSTAAEAALVYARHVGAERCAKLAAQPQTTSNRWRASVDERGFGERYSGGKSPTPSAACFAIASSAVDDEEVEEVGDGEVVEVSAEAVSAAPPAESTALVSAAGVPAPAGSGGVALKRKRRTVVHTVQDDYEIDLRPAQAARRTHTFTFEVPPGARVANVAITFSVDGASHR